jgi:hypothetical protein
MTLTPLPLPLHNKQVMPPLPLHNKQVMPPLPRKPPLTQLMPLPLPPLPPGAVIPPLTPLPLPLHNKQVMPPLPLPLLMPLPPLMLGQVQLRVPRCLLEVTVMRSPFWVVSCGKPLHWNRTLHCATG